MGSNFRRNNQDLPQIYNEPFETDILENSLGEISIISIIAAVLIAVIITLVCLIKNNCNKKQDKKKFNSSIINNDDNGYNSFINKNSIYNNRQKRQRNYEMDEFRINDNRNNNNTNNHINSISSIQRNNKKNRRNENYNNFSNINIKRNNNPNFNNFQFNNNFDNGGNNIINNEIIFNNRMKKNNLNPMTESVSSDYMLDEVGFIISRIPEEPKIGLANIGATCYMNATLQCFSHTIKLANFFFDRKKEKKIRSKNFSREFYEVLKHLWLKDYNRNKTYYEPYDFKQIISDMNPLFQGIQANDAKDLINFILQQLHEDLNEPINKQGIYSFNVDQYNEQQMFNNFIEDFKKNQRSIISDIFFFIIETKTECLNCKQRNQMCGITNPVYLYNFQIMNFLIFPLEEVRKYKIMQYQQNFQDVNLVDCFNYNQKIDYMQGENQMWCKNCQQNSPSQYMSIIYSAPIDFVLILNRGKGNIYNVKLNFDEILDIGNFVFMKQSNNLIYHLYAVVTHIGPSSMGGHFIAFCKSPIDNKWYKYNDAMVEYIGNFHNNKVDIVNFGVPYILFYELQNI